MGVKYFLDGIDVQEIMVRLEKIRSIIKPNCWYKFMKGRLNEDGKSRRAFFAFNIGDDSDLLDHLRELVLFGKFKYPL